eukprot:Phypoly_transcript_00630.p1 GENE.Phypoly_transcript_00630~~Phypoly_transcript_00630.p1  ORF type:complete len:1367 (+),score=377.41 Phypoly_transcript_00630:213-4313(+)
MMTHPVYRLGDCLGKGAAGKVYKGFNVVTGDMCAIKQIKTTYLTQKQLAKAMAEGELLLHLDHPNIVRIFDRYTTGKHMYLVLEYMESGSLGTMVRKFGAFSETLVRGYVAQILAGLQYLHSQGIIHRDIKGGNALVTKDGVVKLADFGEVSLPAYGTVAGSPHWMSPEVIMEGDVTYAADIWSVGCTIVELLTAKPPYATLGAMPTMYRMVEEAHPKLPENISEELRDFLLQCFTRSSATRPSAEQLRNHPWINPEAKPDLDGFTRPRSESVSGTPTYNIASKYNVLEKETPIDMPGVAANILMERRRANSEVGKFETPDMPMFLSHTGKSESVDSFDSLGSHDTTFFGMSEAAILEMEGVPVSPASELGFKLDRLALADLDAAIYGAIDRNATPAELSFAEFNLQATYTSPASTHFMNFADFAPKDVSENPKKEIASAKHEKKAKSGKEKGEVGKKSRKEVEPKRKDSKGSSDKKEEKREREKEIEVEKLKRKDSQGNSETQGITEEKKNDSGSRMDELYNALWKAKEREKGKEKEEKEKERQKEEKEKEKKREKEKQKEKEEREKEKEKLVTSSKPMDLGRQALKRSWERDGRVEKKDNERKDLKVDSPREVEIKLRDFRDLYRERKEKDKEAERDKEREKEKEKEKEREKREKEREKEREEKERAREREREWEREREKEKERERERERLERERIDKERERERLERERVEMERLEKEREREREREHEREREREKEKEKEREREKQKEERHREKEKERESEKNLRGSKEGKDVKLASKSEYREGRDEQEKEKEKERSMSRGKERKERRDSKEKEGGEKKKDKIRSTSRGKEKSRKSDKKADNDAESIEVLKRQRSSAISEHLSRAISPTPRHPKLGDMVTHRASKSDEVAKVAFKFDESLKPSLSAKIESSTRATSRKRSDSVDREPLYSPRSLRDPDIHIGKERARTLGDEEPPKRTDSSEMSKSRHKSAYDDDVGMSKPPSSFFGRPFFQSKKDESPRLRHSSKSDDTSDDESPRHYFATSAPTSPLARTSATRPLSPTTKRPTSPITKLHLPAKFMNTFSTKLSSAPSVPLAKNPSPPSSPRLAYAHSSSFEPPPLALDSSDSSSPSPRRRRTSAAVREDALNAFLDISSPRALASPPSPHFSRHNSDDRTSSSSSSSSSSRKSERLKSSSKPEISPRKSAYVGIESTRESSKPIEISPRRSAPAVVTIRDSAERSSSSHRERAVLSKTKSTDKIYGGSSRKDSDNGSHPVIIKKESSRGNLGLDLQRTRNYRQLPKLTKYRSAEELHNSGNWAEPDQGDPLEKALLRVIQSEVRETLRRRSSDANIKTEDLCKVVKTDSDRARHRRTAKFDSRASTPLSK